MTEWQQFRGEQPQQGPAAAQREDQEGRQLGATGTTRDGSKRCRHTWRFLSKCWGHAAVVWQCSH